MSKLKEQMIIEMELRGFSKKSIDKYVYVVSQFAQFYQKSPDLLGEKEIRDYLHYCITDKKLCEGSVNFYSACLKFFYTKVLHRQWNSDNLPRMKVHKKLPVVLSPDEVNAIFCATKNIKHKAIFMTIYAAGLRVSEVCNLKISDIDSKNMQIAVRKGKGKKDRYTILSEENLKILRDYWKIYRPKEFLFEGRAGNCPIGVKTVQLSLEKAIYRSDISKHATPHTLRHAFATHLLNEGTDICYIQNLLGHANISTTTVYLHLRRYDLLNVKSPLDVLAGENDD